MAQYGSAQTREPLWLVLLGHGSFDTRSARFNLRGPDLSAEQLSEMAEQLPAPAGGRLRILLQRTFPEFTQWRKAHHCYQHQRWHAGAMEPIW